MRSSRLDKARDRVIEQVEEIAEDRGMEITPASNRAYDVSGQDPELRELCAAHKALSDSESLIRANGRSCSDQIYEETLDAGRSIDNAIRSRVEELIEEIIERERARQIEEGMSA